MLRFALLAVLLSAGAWPAGAAAGKEGMDSFFSSLRRPASHNHWLVAPAGFPGRPDATAPVHAVPVAVLRETFKAVIAQSPGAAVVAETADGLQIGVTTRVFQFRDDVRVQFIALGQQQSTLALYSASRTGYWDFGTNRRRLEDWLARLAAALQSRTP
jgi:uncharacterized protein (DUF1499 family)